VAAYIRSVMNKIVSNTVIIEFSKRNESYRKWLDLTLIGVCMLHCSAVDRVRECVAGYVTVSQLVQRIYVNDLLFFDQYVTFVKGLHVKSFPTIHFCSFIAWFSIIPVFPLQCCIRVYCLVCVMHTLRSGYWFLCVVCVLYVLLLLICLVVLHMNCCKCYV
jgi:hypothetical protein